MALGNRVRARREALGIKIDELAKMVGRAFSTIQALEQRDSEKCGYTMKLAKALKTNTYWLTDGQGDPDDVSEFSIPRNNGSRPEPQSVLNLQAVEFACRAIRENGGWKDKEAGDVKAEARLIDVLYRFYILALEDGSEPDPTSSELARIIKLNR